MSEPIRFREKMPVMTSRAVIRAKLRAARVAMGILRKDMMADSRGQERDGADQFYRQAGRQV
ncbi:hypothetical protein CRPA12_47950 [Pseudomonas aeruginosa]|nr:hypothetical protein VNPA110516_28850 [Pseudomonas aeruginosa]GLE76132.1 hypothetical protein VNPA120641_29980 [Pseudomonas aeruginosa]GLE90466.1 hypothetical protein VNPA120719_38590 [Pseudomonas aeruginosa]GLF09658.1 hypothetical protein VNPA131183_31150 [Pseudomonas aeruginosa]GLF15304.1 hypothetical protein VNPA131289_19890 [Pseudomonas aeruginosa]